MARITTKVTVQTFKLATDDEGVAAITVRQATTGDTILRGGLFAETSQVMPDGFGGKIEIKQKWNQHELRRMECWLTITDITGIFDENNNPLFTLKDQANNRYDQQAFFTAWDKLPDSMTREMHKWVLTVNPQWSPNSGAAGE